MAKIIFVTGGSRSGKSSYALELAESVSTSRTFIATCPVMDAEMAERIRLHREERLGRHWDTIEEPVDLIKAVTDAVQQGVIVIDCLTLWINNLMYEAELQSQEFGEVDISTKVSDLLTGLDRFDATVILVTNEVGLGIVPENESARRYRDLVGRCNQIIGKVADELYLVCCSVPLQLKG